MPIKIQKNFSRKLHKHVITPVKFPPRATVVNTFSNRRTKWELSTMKIGCYVPEETSRNHHRTALPAHVNHKRYTLPRE